MWTAGDIIAILSVVFGAGMSYARMTQLERRLDRIEALLFNRVVNIKQQKED